MPEVIVIGGGLAGCEAAFLLAKMGIDVVLYEMKPNRKSPAHHMDTLAELVCSNSLKAEKTDSASGILKREMRRLGSAVLQCADKTRIPAGGALAVDRIGFSQEMTNLINGQPNIRVVREEIQKIPQGDVVIATGPLTDGLLAEDIQRLTGQPLAFYDAAAPIVSHESIDMEQAFFAGRYDQSADYLNCPMDREQYDAFYDALIHADVALTHDFDVRHFEGCMPIESMAKRGYQTPLFGTMSPKGIKDPKTGRRPYALLQLRRENGEGTLWNMVGFQTNLKFKEQKRVFSMIPALHHAEFVRYGVMHRNTYLPSGVLDDKLSMKSCPRIRFAGQITGVEGYMESAATGMLAGLYCGCSIMHKKSPNFGQRTAMGALLHYVSDYQGNDFQPMNSNFSIMAQLDQPIRDKAKRHQAISELAEKEFTAALAACDMEETNEWK